MDVTENELYDYGLKLFDKQRHYHDSKLNIFEVQLKFPTGFPMQTNKFHKEWKICGAVKTNATLHKWCLKVKEAQEALSRAMSEGKDDIGTFA